MLAIYYLRELHSHFISGLTSSCYRTLEYVTNYTLFTTFCIVIRGFEALGASAFSTASYVFVVNTFPQNIGSVLVSYFNFHKKIHLFFQGILETFVGLGMSTGPALGGVLYSVYF